jgi:hypothetical protein
MTATSPPNSWQDRLAGCLKGSPVKLLETTPGAEDNGLD